LISLYFHTLRYLKFKQIYRRIWFNLYKPRLAKRQIPNLRFSKNEFFIPVQRQASLINKETFLFLNKSGDLSEIGWNGKLNYISKLWRYNQHYFDDLNALQASERKEWHYKLLERWVKENPMGYGVGWEPYPTSLRIVNWIKWYFSKNILTHTCKKSLATQVRWLNKRIEWHILGNHLISNAKALIFAGLFFSGKEADSWLKKGLKIIDKEVTEQVLSDGGNFELSPMYHSIFLEDLLDLINISSVFPNLIPVSNINKWKKKSYNMLKWLDTMVHPDGDISFFNDAAIGISPKLYDLIEYSKRLGLTYSLKTHEKINHLADSGYIRLNFKNVVVLLDVARIGPDYLPGHAHADTLSFELSLFGNRLLVNGGTSQYGSDSIRQIERSTMSHNTVTINDKNSSEVWGGFRVARRAQPFNLIIEELDNYLNVSCSHTGYQRLSGQPIHRREWKLFESSLMIKDNIEGPFKNAFAYFHFHPSIKLNKNKTGDWNLKIPNGHQARIHVEKGEPKIEKSFYSPEFNKRFEIQCLKIELVDRESCVNILWEN
jgi:uncharacterized heparinase superfamily protein